LLAGAATLGAPALAQQSAPTTSASSSWIPGPGKSYLGLSVGRSKYDLPCGATTFTCDSSATSANLYAGTMIGNFWGAEVGYVDMGSVARAGGDTRARGLNLSLVGRAPIGASFGVFGKLGTTYGRTETSSALSSGIANGSENGFGLSYGAGVSWDFSPKLSATLAWDSHDFHFAGGVRDPVRSTSLGLQYRY